MHIVNNGGSQKGEFKLELTNGKFSDGNISKIVSEGITVEVLWNDTININAGIKITQITTLNPLKDTLVAGVKQIMFSKIASLKGQTPILYFNGNPNQPIGNKQQFTAIVNDMIYPGIKDTTFYIITERKVKYFEWTLPNGWKTTQNQTGTFITGNWVKQINVIPDYVTKGTIKVRGVNDYLAGFSEYTLYDADRGLNHTQYPTTITFGDTTPKTFSVTLFSGINYEWLVPPGWDINGHGNSYEALNLNSVTITPNFCNLETDSVKFRLKKGNDVSPWYDFSDFSGVSMPIITPVGTHYQFEESHFTLSNMNSQIIDSIVCNDPNVCFTYHSGSNLRFVLFNTGNYTFNVLVYISGCLVPVEIPVKVYSVQPNRLSIIGPTLVCNNATYSIENQNLLPNGTTISWQVSRHLSITGGQGLTTVNVSKARTTSSAFIEAVLGFCGKTITINKSGIKVGTQAPLIKVYNSNGTAELAPPYYTGTNYKIVAYLEGSAYLPNEHFSWQISPPISCNDNNTLLYNGWAIPFSTECVGNHIVKLRFFNQAECGWSDEVSSSIYFHEGSMMYAIYPNPANELLTVEILDDTLLDDKSNTNLKKRKIQPFTIEIWDSNHNLHRSVNSNEKVIKINISDLAKGRYFIHLKTSGQQIQRKSLTIE